MKPSKLTLVIVIAGLLSSIDIQAQRAGQGAERAAEAERRAQQAAREQEQLAVDQQRRTLEQERQGLEQRQEEMRAARAEMEVAREQLEAAARRVADLSVSRGGAGLDPMRNLAFLSRLTPFELQRRAVLGINAEDADTGVRVVGVTPSGTAAAAGIQSGDIIASIDGHVLVGAGESPTERLIVRMRDIDPGSSVPVIVIRDGEEQVVNVETQDAPPYASYMFRGSGNSGPAVYAAPGRRADSLSVGDGDFFNFNVAEYFRGFDRGWREMELVALSEGLGGYFGTDEGLLVVRAPDTDELGLEDGDVILEIGGRVPSSPQHAMSILRSFEPGERLELEIMRRQRRQQLEYELPARNQARPEL